MLPLLLASASVIGTISSIGSTNRQANLSIDEQRRRYELKETIAKDQMEEQASLAMSKMTDVSREFIQVKSRMSAVQAESGVSGNVAKRATLNLRSKASELKGDIRKEINTNIVNIANSMLAEKIDTDSRIAQLEANKITGIDALSSVIQSGISGYSLGNDLASTDLAKMFSGKASGNAEIGGVSTLGSLNKLTRGL